MSTNPPVTVEPIAMPDTPAPSTGLESDNPMAGLVAKLHAARAAEAGRVYRLTWKGSKVPRGARIGSHEIVWTQHGMVHARNARGDVEEIGTYKRVVEFGGANQDEQIMEIYLDGNESLLATAQHRKG